MKKNAVSRLLFLSALVLFAVLLGACQEKPEPAATAAATASQVAPASQAAPAEARPAEPEAASSDQSAPVPENQALEILRFGPSGELNRLSQLVVMFNQPMVALGAYEQVPEGVFSFEPPLTGKSVWLNQYSLAFVPETVLTGSLEFKAALNPGPLTALSGAKLAEGREISVKLPDLGVLRKYQVSRRARDEDQALLPGWRVTFNQAPDPESLNSKARYVWWGGLETKSMAALAEVRPDSQGREFTFSPAERLPKNTGYSLILEEGVKSLAGPKPAPRLVLGEARTYGPLTAKLETYRQDKVDPESGLYLNFSNPVRLSEVAPLVKIDNGYDLEAFRRQYVKAAPAEGGEESAGQAEDELEDVDDIQNYLYLPGGLKAESSYTLSLDASAKDIFGQSLGADFVKTFQTGQYDTFLRLSNDFGLLETATKPWLRLTASNIKEARLEGYSLSAEEAIKFLAAAGFSPDYYGGDLSEAEATLKGLKPEVLTLPVPGAAFNGRTAMKVDLAGLFGRDLKGRFLYVRSEWEVPGQNPDENYRDQTFAMALVSDIGLAIKIGPEASLIWTSDLARGRSWPEVELELRDAENQLLWSGKSDEDGLARLPGSAEIRPKAHSDSLFVVARAAGQMSLWNADWNDGLEIWRWNIGTGEALNSEPQEKNWLLSALPLYKPGETAKFKVIARQQNGDSFEDLAGRELDLEILDGRGEVAARAEVKTNELGTFSYELPLPANAALGYWTVQVAPSGREDMDMVGSFRVINYRAPAFEIEFEDLPQEAVCGDELKIDLKADYHFGAPVSGRPVKYSVVSNPGYFSLPGNFSHYSVSNNFKITDEDDDQGEYYSEPSVTVASDLKKLDQAGRFSFKLNLSPAPDQLPRPRSYSGFVTVEDVDQRQVSTNASVLVHPAALYAGLFSDNFVTEAGQPYSLKLIVADLEGRLIPGRRVSATLYRRNWQNVRRKSAGTAYEYVSRMVDSQIESRDLTSADLPLDLALTPPEPGYYWVLVETKDDKGRVNQASYDFYASGGGPVGWSMSNDDRVSLVADKKEYKPGETARIMVQSPFDRGQGLMTVERAGVIRSQVFDIENQTPVLEIPLEEEDSPNVFVSVLLSRGRIADKLDERGLDFGKPAIRLGYIELKVPSKKNLFQVKVESDKAEVGPGGEVEVGVRVTDQEGRPVKRAELAVIAADAAVLQLGGENNYHPERRFHQDQLLRVQTADNLVSLIGRQNWGSKGDNPGGGGGPMGAMAGGQDGVRRLFAALAFFEPALPLDEDGRAKIKIKMPENLSTFKILAVATGTGRLTGTGQTSVLVSRDLLVRSALPGYAGVGDEFAAAMVLSNRGQKSGRATVRLSGENFSLVDDQAEKTVEIGPGGNEELRFRVKAGPEAVAKFLFEVSMGQESDKVEYSLPVSPANKLSTQASYERLGEGRLVTDLALTEGLDPSRGGLELQVSPSLIGVLDEPFHWLLAYPHGCVEQATSKAYASLVWLNLKDRLKGTEEQAQTARNNVNAHLKRLVSWDQGGGFNYWPNNYNWSNRSVYLSAYVLDFVLAARESGFELPDPDQVERISAFLKEALNAESKAFPSWYSERAVREAKSYVLAMLSRAGQNVAAYIELEYTRRESLSLFELINLIRAVGFSPEGPVREERLKALLPLLDKHLLLTAGEVQFVESEPGAPEIWSSSVRSSAMTLSALCETAPKHDLIPGLMRWLVSASRSGHFDSTQNNAVTLAALGQYVKIMEPGDPDLKVAASLGDKTLLEAHFQSYRDPAVRAAAPLGDIPEEYPAVVYETSGRGQAWAALKMKSAPLEPDLAPASSGGFMLSRSFTVLAPEAGTPGASRFRRGDLVRVSVTMMVPAPRHNVVLEDRVPAGFEPINFRLPDADQTLRDLAREDDGESDYRRVFWYNHQEIWPDRVAVYADHLDAGVYTYSYLARAVTSGSYLTPGPQAEEMYAPETFGRGSGHRLVVD